MNKSPSGIYGARLLKEMEAEEGSLEDLLSDLRKHHLPAPPLTASSTLDAVIRSHGGRLSATGRALPLLYHVLVGVVKTQKCTVCVIDLTGRFSPSHLRHDLSRGELRHIHVFHPTRESFKETLGIVEGYMLHGDHGSMEREWKGSVIVGADGLAMGTALVEKAKVFMMVGWRGWLSVEREEMRELGRGISAKEAAVERDSRWEVAKDRVWRVQCDAGEYSWS